MNGTGRAALRRPRITQSLLFELRAFTNITGDGKADPLLRNVTTGEWIYYATGNRACTAVWACLRRRLAIRGARRLRWPRARYSAAARSAHRGAPAGT